MINKKQKHEQKQKQKKQTKGNQIIRIRQEKHAPQQATQERHPVCRRMQPRQEDKGKDNECDTQREKNTERGKGDNNQMKLKN